MRTELGLSGGTVYRGSVAYLPQRLRVGQGPTLKLSDRQRVWPEAGARIREP
ncbi:MAG: hypothetical protein AB1505_01955 [Candidatus Latescibacterota bacterium]